MILATFMAALFGLVSPEVEGQSTLIPSRGGLTDTGISEPTADVPEAFDEATAAFSARLNLLHPPGSAVADLVATLEADGFVLVEAEELKPGEGAARLEKPGFMCQLIWTVNWTEEARLIVTIDGLHDGICL